MNRKSDKLYYTGIPQEQSLPDKWKQLPYANLDKANDAALYVAPQGLRDAVNVALELGLPLLLTGEPGVGKSTLARSLNLELGHRDQDLLHHTVKSDSKDNELFYSYDTLGRFHAVHGQVYKVDERARKKAYQDADPRRYIRYQALGMAILRAKGRDNIPEHIMTDNARKNFPSERSRAVVLIDEIDKAPRDLPNDILNEIERMEFRIPELFIDQPIKLESEDDKQHRPIVIITSNGERELPEAFLRRCLYYHLSMPPFKEDLEQSPNDPNAVSVEAIVASRFSDGQFDGKETLLNEALSLFRFLRRNQDQRLQRMPSLAEFLDWLRYLSYSDDPSPLTQRNNFRVSLSTTLLKNQGDQQKIDACIKAWQSQTSR